MIDFRRISQLLKRLEEIGCERKQYDLLLPGQRPRRRPDPLGRPLPKNLLGRPWL